jgi:6-pyruvoyltetrahydropterin/6-carboxytetrahydropterin synthase
MDDPIVEISCKAEFSAAHRLHNPELTGEENRRIYGICNNANGHGHNYEVEVTVAGPVAAGTGMVLDLLRLTALVRERIVEPLDHKNLNVDVPFLHGTIPTAENIAVACWARIEPSLQPYPGCQLQRIRLYESRNSFVEYRGRRTTSEGWSSSS